MPADIKVDYGQPKGCLSLSCSDEAFARIRDALIAEAGNIEAISGPVDGIQTIYIEITTAPTVRNPSRLRDRVALVGCGLIAFVILFVFIAGISAIAESLW